MGFFFVSFVSLCSEMGLQPSLEQRERRQLSNSSRNCSVSRTIYLLFLGNLGVPHIILSRTEYPNPRFQI
jgi:hypothetical protein